MDVFSEDEDNSDEEASQSLVAQEAGSWIRWIPSLFPTNRRQRRRQRHLPEEHSTRFSSRLQGLEAEDHGLPMKSRRRRKYSESEDHEEVLSWLRFILLPFVWITSLFAWPFAYLKRDSAESAGEDVFREHKNQDITDDIITDDEDEPEIHVMSNQESSIGGSIVSIIKNLITLPPLFMVTIIIQAFQSAIQFLTKPRTIRRQKRVLPEEHPTRVSRRLRGIDADDIRLPERSRRRHLDEEVQVGLLGFVWHHTIMAISHALSTTWYVISLSFLRQKAEHKKAIQEVVQEPTQEEEQLQSPLTKLLSRLQGFRTATL